MMNGLPSISLQVIDYAAQECHWQQSGELSVSRMVHAWYHAALKSSLNMKPAMIDILELGRIIEPDVNSRGLRRQGVTVQWAAKMDWSLVEPSLERLVSFVGEVHTQKDAEQWYRNFEEIHPFVDGNGRTGSILYNWLRGSIHHPEHAPDFWGDNRKAKS